MESKRGSGDTPTRRVCLREVPHGLVVGAAKFHDLGTLARAPRGFGFWLLISAVALWLLPSEFHKVVIVISRLDLRTVCADIFEHCLFIIYSCAL